MQGIKVIIIAVLLLSVIDFTINVLKCALYVYNAI